MRSAGRTIDRLARLIVAGAAISLGAPTAWAQAPTDDPDWSAEDARYSVVRWLPSTTENASGPNIHDPRSGEILEADIQFFHNVQNLQKNWYFVQAGPLDPRARTLPLPDDLMGDAASLQARWNTLSCRTGDSVGEAHAS